MAVTAHWYDTAIRDENTGSGINWITDFIKVALLTSGYTPNQGTDHVFSDVSANETSGTGYVAGGMLISSPSANLAAHVLTLDAADIVWTVSTITARYAVIYDTTVANKLLGYVDFGANVSSSGASFTIVWNAAGILSITMT